MPKVKRPSGIREVCHIYDWHRQKRTGNSLTRSKARKGFPVRVGAHTEWAVRRPHKRAAYQRGRSSLWARSNEPNCERLSRVGNRVLPRSARRNRRWSTIGVDAARDESPRWTAISLTGGPSSDLTTNSMCVTNRGRSKGCAGWFSPRCSKQRVLWTGSVAQVEAARERWRCFRRKSGRGEKIYSRTCTARQS